VVIAEEWLGGEIWHAWFAARARMLEYALGLERKIADANLGGENKLFVLALCGEGFRTGWRTLSASITAASTVGRRLYQGRAEVHIGQEINAQSDDFPVRLYETTAKSDTPGKAQLECQTAPRSFFLSDAGDFPKDIVALA
jgi:hypothetical protein